MSPAAAIDKTAAAALPVRLSLRAHEGRRTTTALTDTHRVADADDPRPMRAVPDAEAMPGRPKIVTDVLPVVGLLVLTRLLMEGPSMLTARVMLLTTPTWLSTVTAMTSLLLPLSEPPPMPPSTLLLAVFMAMAESDVHTDASGADPPAAPRIRSDDMPELPKDPRDSSVTLTAPVGAVLTRTLWLKSGMSAVIDRVAVPVDMTEAPFVTT